MQNVTQKLTAAAVCLAIVLSGMALWKSTHLPAPQTHRLGATVVEQGLRLNQLAPPNAAVAMNSQKITGLANGTASGDAVHFGQSVTDTTNGLMLATDKTFFDQQFNDGFASGFVQVDDFCTGGAYTTGAAAVPTTVGFGSLDWRSNLSGTGAAITFVTTSQDATHHCVLQIDRGTTATGIAQGVRAPASTTGLRTLGSTQTFTYGIVVRQPTLSDATNTFALRAGLVGSSGSAVDGIYFEADANADTHFRCKACSASTCTSDSAAASVTIAINTWYHLSYVYDGTGPTLTCKVDGTTIGTITTGFPSVALSEFFEDRGTAGTLARTWLIDWVLVGDRWSTNRAQ